MIKKLDILHIYFNKIEVTDLTEHFYMHNQIYIIAQYLFIS